MAANNIDFDEQDSDESIDVNVAGTVTNTVRVTWDDGADPAQIIRLVSRAAALLSEKFLQA